VSTPDRGTGPVTDEELLIQLARRERRATRSRRGVYTMLAVAAFLALLTALAWPAGMYFGLLLFAAYAGISALILVIAAVATALPGRAAKARRAETAPARALGSCPACGSSALREYSIRYVNGGATPFCGGRGVATLCAAPGCDYATARVASRRTLRSVTSSAARAVSRRCNRCPLLAPVLGSPQPR
jgi:hypothetical protein